MNPVSKIDERLESLRKGKSVGEQRMKALAAQMNALRESVLRIVGGIEELEKQRESISEWVQAVASSPDEERIDQ